MDSTENERRKSERRQTIDRRRVQRYGEAGKDRRHRLGRRDADQRVPWD